MTGTARVEVTRRFASLTELVFDAWLDPPAELGQGFLNRARPGPDSAHPATGLRPFPSPLPNREEW